jgi:hypothetical protein
MVIAFYFEDDGVCGAAAATATFAGPRGHWPARVGVPARRGGTGPVRVCVETRSIDRPHASFIHFGVVAAHNMGHQSFVQLRLLLVMEIEIHHRGNARRTSKSC